MKYNIFIILLTVLFVLSACSSAPEASSQNKAALETAVSEAERTYIVKEKFEQDGRYFVSVRDKPGDGGQLIQVEIREKAVWDAVRKEGAITFGKSWQVTEIDWVGIEEILRGDS